MTLSRRQFLAISSGAALAGTLTGALEGVRAQGLIPINVGVSSHNFDVVPVWIALDRQFFEKYGLSVTLVEFQGGARAVAAMVGGDVPMASIGAPDIVNARSKGVPLQVIAGLINKFSFDFVVAKDITSAAQLRGAKGAISSFGGSSDFATRFALAKLGIDPQDVTLLQVGNESSRLTALQSGQIKFTVLTAGLDVVAFDLGYKPMLKLYTLDQPFVQLGIGVNTGWARTHADVVDSFLRALIAAIVYIKNPLNLAAAMSLTRRRLPLKDEHLKRGFQLYRTLFAEYPFVSAPGMEFILRANKVNQPVTDFYDNSYIQALQNANFATTAGKGP